MSSPPILGRQPVDDENDARAHAQAPSKVSDSKITVLMHAVLARDLKLVKWLCKNAQADVNLTDEFGCSAVHYACRTNHLKELIYLYKYGADVELRDATGVTPLITAITSGSRECAEYLIREAKCNILSTDNDGLNAFLRCCATGEMAMAQWLVEKGGFRPYINTSTTKGVTLEVKTPGQLPDLATSIAATELYIEHLRQSNIDLGNIDVLDDELDLTIAELVNTIDSYDLPLQQTALGGGDGGASLERSSRQGSFDGSLTRQSSVPSISLEDEFTSPLRMSISQLAAARHLASISDHLSLESHSGFVKNTILIPSDIPVAVQMNAPGGAQPKQHASLKKAEWEQSLPSTPQTSDGDLFLLARALDINRRDIKLDLLFYQKASIKATGSATLPSAPTPRASGYPGATTTTTTTTPEVVSTPSPRDRDRDHIRAVKSPKATKTQTLVTMPVTSNRSLQGPAQVSFAPRSSPLMIAAGCGHFSMVQWLCHDLGADTLHLDGNGRTAWMVALISKHVDIFEYLFRQHAHSLDECDRFGRTSLMNAVLNKDLMLVLFLLILGSNVNVVDQNGRTCLMHAALGGAADVAKVLIDSGADLHVEDHDGRDAQTMAVSGSQWSVVKLLEDELEKKARLLLELEGVTDDLGLDSDEDTPTIDWNGVMQSAQDLGVDVVDYCTRAGIPLHTLDKSGRTFLHHTAINGRFEHVRCLVEKGLLNIKAKQLKAFRVYAKSTKGMNTLQMVHYKRWYNIYCYLFLHSALMHDARPMDRIVSKHRDVFSNLDIENIREFVIYARDILAIVPNTLITCLRISAMFTEIAKMDRIHRYLYQQFTDEFDQYARQLLENIPHLSLAAWTLEEPDALNNTAIKVAAQSDNTDFLSHPFVDKCMSLWWHRQDEPSTVFPIAALIRRPFFKRLLEEAALIARIVIFTVFLVQWVDLNERLTVMELLSYIFSLGQMIPPLPPSTKRVNTFSMHHLDLSSAAGGSSGLYGDANQITSPGVPGGGAGAGGGGGASPEHPPLIIRPVPSPSPDAAPAPQIEMTAITGNTGGNTSQDTSSPTPGPGPLPSSPAPPGDDDSFPLSQSSMPQINVSPGRRASVTNIRRASVSYMPSAMLSPSQPALNEESDSEDDRLEETQDATLHEHAHQTGLTGHDLKLARRKLSQKRSTKWELFIEHLTNDGWAFVDVIIAIFTLFVLIVRVLPSYDGPAESFRYAVYLTSMCVLCILFYLRLLELFFHLESTGPLLITIFKMIKDVKQFTILFFIPMLATFFVFYFLAVDTRQPDAEGFEDIHALIISLWRCWWGEVEYASFNEFDLTRQILLTLTAFFMTFLSSIFLLNLLVGIMSNTIGEVQANAHAEFASHLVQRRWKFDQATLQPPSPLNSIHLFVSNALTVWAKVPFCKNLSCYKNRKHLYCAYCSNEWNNAPFSISRPTSGVEKRFPPIVLFEYSQAEAGLRLCNHCLRAQRVLNWQMMMSERVAGWIVTALIFVPLLLYLITIFPIQKCREFYLKWKIEQENKSFERFYSPPIRTPYDYSYFEPSKLPSFQFQFEKNNANLANPLMTSAQSPASPNNRKAAETQQLLTQQHRQAGPSDYPATSA